jgi:hypothetical protein
MKKLLFVCGAIAMGVVLAPRAYAGTITFDHINGSYTLTSDVTADEGSNVSVVNAYIENTSGTGSGSVCFCTGLRSALGAFTLDSCLDAQARTMISPSTLSES